MSQARDTATRREIRRAVKPALIDDVADLRKRLNATNLKLEGLANHVASLNALLVKLAPQATTH